MSYTSKQRRQIAADFQTARRKIASGGIYICYVLCDPSAIHIVETRMGKMQGGYVRRANGGFVSSRAFSLEHWLHDRGVPYRQTTPSNMREYRLRWLDALIKEFSN